MSIPTVICMWNMEPYLPWKDGLWSWFRKWFSPGLRVLPRTTGFHRVSSSKHTWKADFGKGQSQHLCRNLVCSHFYHMLVSILSFCLHVMLAVDDSTVISLFFPLPCHSFEKNLTSSASDAVSQLNCTKECLLKSTSIANVKNNLNNKIR